MYAASATVAGGTKTSPATQSYADLVLEGGDGVGITVPDPGAEAHLVVRFTASVLCSAQCAASFVLVVDGLPIAESPPYTTDSFGASSVLAVAVTGSAPIKAGAAHTVKVRWRANVGTMSIGCERSSLAIASSIICVSGARLRRANSARNQRPSGVPRKVASSAA